MRELTQLVSTPNLQRQDSNEITLFKSVGMAIEDIAVAAIVYERALENEVGRSLGL